MRLKGQRISRSQAYPVFCPLVCVDNHTQKQKSGSQFFHFSVLWSTQTEEQNTGQVWDQC